MDRCNFRCPYCMPEDKYHEHFKFLDSTERLSFDEILRVLDSMQLTVKHKVATPANWNSGDDVIIVPAVSDDAAKEMFPEGWNAVNSYIRVVKQPN